MIARVGRERPNEAKTASRHRSAPLQTDGWMKAGPCDWGSAAVDPQDLLGRGPPGCQNSL